jgi:hypothetical protein
MAFEVSFLWVYPVPNDSNNTTKTNITHISPVKDKGTGETTKKRCK